MPGRRWTPREDRILKSNYWRGSRAVHRLLAEHGFTDRRARSVNDRAMRLGLYTGPKNGLIPASDVHPDTAHHASRRIKSRARRDGVLVDMGRHARPRWFVPQDWADVYAERHGDALAKYRAGWLSTGKLAELFGVSTTHMSNAIHKSTACAGLQEAVDGIRRVEHPVSVGFIWHPGDAAEAALKWRGMRRAA